MRDTPRLAILETWGFSSPRRRLTRTCRSPLQGTRRRTQGTMLGTSPSSPHLFLGRERTGEKSRILRTPCKHRTIRRCEIACYPFFAFLVLSDFLARVKTSRSAVPL